MISHFLLSSVVGQSAVNIERKLGDVFGDDADTSGGDGNLHDVVGGDGYTGVSLRQKLRPYVWL